MMRIAPQVYGAARESGAVGRPCFGRRKSLSFMWERGAGRALICDSDMAGPQTVANASSGSPRGRNSSRGRCAPARGAPRRARVARDACAGARARRGRGALSARGALGALVRSAEDLSAARAPAASRGRRGNRPHAQPSPTGLTVRLRAKAQAARARRRARGRAPRQYPLRTANGKVHAFLSF